MTNDPLEVETSLAKLARCLRKRRGVVITKKEVLSLREAAKLSGVSHNVLWRAEQGRPISLENFQKIIRWLRGGVQ